MLPAEGEEWLLVALIAILLLGAARRAVEPTFAPPLGPPPAVDVHSFGLLDLNAADAAALETLPGIGPRLAARIVEDRRSAGRFDSVGALVRVKGIGPKTVARLRPAVTVVSP